MLCLAVDPVLSQHSGGEQFERVFSSHRCQRDGGEDCKQTRITFLLGLTVAGLVCGYRSSWAAE